MSGGLSDSTRSGCFVGTLAQDASRNIAASANALDLGSPVGECITTGSFRESRTGGADPSPARSQPRHSPSWVTGR